MNAFDFPARPIALAVGALLLLFLLVRATVLRKSESLLIPLLLCAVLAGVLVWQVRAEARWQRIQAEAARVVSMLADAPADVHCQRLSETYLALSTAHGALGPPGDAASIGTVYLTYQTCSDLGEWLDRPGSDPTPAQIAAVHALTHQTAHLLGQVKESFAECDGMHMDAGAAQALGADPVQARRLARDYRQDLYPSQPKDYQSSACPVL